MFLPNLYSYGAPAPNGSPRTALISMPKRTPRSSDSGTGTTASSLTLVEDAANSAWPDVSNPTTANTQPKKSRRERKPNTKLQKLTKISKNDHGKGTTKRSRNPRLQTKREEAKRRASPKTRYTSLNPPVLPTSFLNRLPMTATRESFKTASTNTLVSHSPPPSSPATSESSQAPDVSDLPVSDTPNAPKQTTTKGKRYAKAVYKRGKKMYKRNVEHPVTTIIMPKVGQYRDERKEERKRRAARKAKKAVERANRPKGRRGFGLGGEEAGTIAACIQIFGMVLGSG